MSGIVNGVAVSYTPSAPAVATDKLAVGPQLLHAVLHGLLVGDGRPDRVARGPQQRYVLLRRHDGRAAVAGERRRATLY